MMRYLAILLMVNAALAGWTFAEAPTSAPSGSIAKSGGLATLPELRAMLGRGENLEVIQQTARVLALKGAAAEPYPRAEVWALKAEAHLRMKSPAPATEAFAQAAKAASGAERQRYQAQEFLMRRSRSGTFVPKSSEGKPAEPIDVIDPEKRKEAASALLADELAALRPKLESAKKATTLAPLMQAAKGVGDLRAVEMYATGAGAETTKIADEIADLAIERVKASMDAAHDQCDAIFKQAMTLVKVERTVGGGNYLVTEHAGLTSVDIKELKRIAAATMAVPEPMRQLARDLGEEESRVAPAIQAAEKTAKRADFIYNYRYQVPLLR